MESLHKTIVSEYSILEALAPLALLDVNNVDSSQRLLH